MVARLKELERRELYESEPDTNCSYTGFQRFRSGYGFFLRLALRRCGAVPTGKGAFRFVFDEPLLYPESMLERDSSWEDVDSTKTCRDALQKFGSPDAISDSFQTEGNGVLVGEVWDYYSGLRDEVKVHRFVWRAGTNGEELERFEVLPLKEEIGEHLVLTFWERYG